MYDYRTLAHYLYQFLTETASHVTSVVFFSHTEPLQSLYGSSRNLACDMSPSWTFQTDNSDIKTPVVASNNIQLGGKVLTIISTNSSHEGIYQCHANKKFNLTVLGEYSVSNDNVL